MFLLYLLNEKQKKLVILILAHLDITSTFEKYRNESFEYAKILAIVTKPKLRSIFETIFKVVVFLNNTLLIQ